MTRSNIDKLFAVLLAKQTQLKSLAISYIEWVNSGVYTRDIAFASLADFMLQQRSLECLQLYLCEISMPTAISCVRKSNATLVKILLDLRKDPFQDDSAGMCTSLSHMEALASCFSLETLEIYMQTEDLNVVSFLLQSAIQGKSTVHAKLGDLRDTKDYH